MHLLHKQKAQLLMTIDEMLEAAAGEVELSDDNWEDMRGGLLALGLPDVNQIFALITNCRGDINALHELRKCFRRFYDAQILTAAKSSIISESYKDEVFGGDREFTFYADTIRKNTASAMISTVYDSLTNVQKESPDYYKTITEGSRGWYFESNWLDGVGGANNSLIVNRVNVLKNNIDHFEWLYDNLADAISRRSLNALIKFWLTWDYTDWRNIALYSNDVVDTSIYSFYDDEVFVDCGSYIGDTVIQYVNTVNKNYRRVYTYDISSASIELIKQNLSTLPNVVINHKGTGEVNGEMDMIGVDKAFYGNKLSTGGGGNIVEKVKVVRLDDDINEPVTFLKIDCEGMDKETLRGARNIIRKYHPKLHVDSYHKLADIIDVPRLIREIDPSYALYLRLPTTLDSIPRFPAPAYMAI